ncbi:MAG TPA: hypothetical protein VJ952_03165 [Opitutales bacterium]|nr:hypothetical protein [Opitutales bacterium]
MKTRKSLLNHLALVSLIALASGASSAQAQTFTLLDDFESYTTGSTSSSDAFVAQDGPWTGWAGGDPTGSSLITVDESGGNKFLQYGWQGGQRGAYRSLTAPISNTASGTYYFQIWSSNDSGNASYGLSDSSSPNSGFDSFNVQISFVGLGSSLKLVGRDGASDVDLATGLSEDTWYDIWLDVDNVNDTFDVYYGTTGDPGTMGTLVGSDLAFRSSTTNSLVTFAALDDGSNGSNTQEQLDNIYYNVVPEPSAFALLAGCFGMTWIMLRRRC